MTANSRSLGLTYDAGCKLLDVIFLGSSPFAATCFFVYNVINHSDVHGSGNILSKKLLVYGLSTLFLVLIASNTIVYTVLLKQKRAIRAITISKNQQPQLSESTDKLTKIKNDIRAFYICLGCVFSYIILWLPALVVQALLLFSESFFINDKVLSLVNFVAHFNLLGDAFILIWFNKELKMNIKKLFKKRLHVNNSTENIESVNDISQAQSNRTNTFDIVSSL